MRAIKKVKWLFWLSVAFISIMSTTILFMPMAVNSMRNIWVVVVGLSFYIGAIGGYVLVIIAGVLRKKHFTNLKDIPKNIKVKLGVFSFFSNLPAAIFDVLMFVSIVAFATIYLLGYEDTYIAFVTLSIMVLSINMHCLFNGRIYRLIKI